MRIDFVTLFPEMFEGPMTRSIVGRAREKGLVDVRFFNPREFSSDKHRKVDDRPYGGGAGMVLMAQPVCDAVKASAGKTGRVVHLSARGARFDQAAAARLSRERHLVFVCGHYEGVDERAGALFDEELSIGDFVLTGGELPAMIAADAVVRLAPGVLKAEATALESFSDGLLEHPQYTRPRVWRGKRVPEALLSGDHRRIAEWRRKASAARTKRSRPDLIAKGKDLIEKERAKAGK